MRTLACTRGLLLRSYDALELRLRMRGEGMREVMRRVRFRTLVYIHYQIERGELSVVCSTHRP